MALNASQMWSNGIKTASNKMTKIREALGASPTDYYLLYVWVTLLYMSSNLDVFTFSLLAYTLSL